MNTSKSSKERAKRADLAARKKRFAAQRRKQGWDDSETWSLDWSLAKLILPRLKRFREIGAPTGTPGHIKTSEEWLAIVDSMIAAFELVAREAGAWLTKKESAIVQRGLRAFAKHYLSLWW